MICATTVRRASGFRQSFVSTSVRCPSPFMKIRSRNPPPTGKLTGQRAKTSEERLDVSDWYQRGVCEQQVLKCEFIERSLIEWNSTKRGRLAVSHEYRGHKLSIFHIVTDPHRLSVASGCHDPLGSTCLGSSAVFAFQTMLTKLDQA